MEGLVRRQFLPVDSVFYLYADVPRFCSDSLDFARRVLEEAGVAATPGADLIRCRETLHPLLLCGRHG
jgi:aspartate/methionine/tyrosine aminotransferase